MPEWLPHVLSFAAALLSGCAGAWAITWKARRDAVAAGMLAEAGVQTSINDGFAKLTKGLQDEVDRAQDEVKTLRNEMKELEGWIRDLIQHIESLERNLSENGLDIPERNIPHPLLARKTN